MVFHWPQITWCALAVLSLLLHAANNGKTFEKTYNFPLQLMCAVLVAGLLYMGGFFSGGCN